MAQGKREGDFGWFGHEESIIGLLPRGTDKNSRPRLMEGTRIRTVMAKDVKVVITNP